MGVLHDPEPSGSANFLEVLPSTSEELKVVQASGQPAHQPGPSGLTTVLTRYGDSNEVVSPACLPGAGNSRADSGLPNLAAKLPKSTITLARTSRGTSPGTGTVSSPVPHTADHKSSWSTLTSPCSQRQARSLSSITGSISPE